MPAAPAALMGMITKLSTVALTMNSMGRVRCGVIKRSIFTVPHEPSVHRVYFYRQRIGWLIDCIEWASDQREDARHPR